MVPFTVLSLALAVVAAAQPASAASPEDAMPVPQATRDGAPASVKDVLKACKGANCDFRIAQKPTEYLSAVTTVGSAIVNCSDADMTVEREVTLTSSISDNVEGEISGEWTHEGTVDKTVWGEGHAEHTEEARLQNTGTTTVTGTTTDTESKESGSTHHTSPKDKGPNDEQHGKIVNQKETQTQNQNSAETQTEVTSSSTGSVTAHDELHVGVREAFTTAFRLTAGQELTQSVEERMMYSITLKPKDILTLGAQNAMVRTQGTLRVNDSKGAATVENITVNSPSTTNASSLIAQTYTDAGKCIGVRPAENAADPQPGPRPRTGDSAPGPQAAQEAARPLPAAPGLYELPAPPAGATPDSVSMVPLPPGTAAQP